MIFYDGNRFPELRGMFLVPSYKEGTIYALSLNESGIITNEIAIRLPEIRGHIVAIASTPNGEIYIAGENIYKIVTIDKDPTHFYILYR